MYKNTEFGTVKCVLFIEVSSFQSVLKRGGPTVYTCRVAFRKWMMGGQNVELSVARLNVCTVLHVKPEKNLGGQEATKGGANAPPAPPP